MEGEGGGTSLRGERRKKRRGKQRGGGVRVGHAGRTNEGEEEE